MTFKNTPFPRKTKEGSVGCGKCLRCNICRRRFQATDGYYRCNSDDCDYDICNSCGNASEAERRMNWTHLFCDKEHMMFHRTDPFQRYQKLGPGFQLANGTNLSCNKCNGPIDIS